MAKCVEVLNSFVLGKEDSSLELALIIVIKVREPFLRIRKKIGT